MPMVQQRFSFIPETRHAFLSEDRMYRYALYRSLDGLAWSDLFDAAGRERRVVLFILLNPSVADEHLDDPTILKCMKYARAFGGDLLVVGNVFAYRETESRKLAGLAASGVDLVGPKNDEWLKTLSSVAVRTICGWGNQGLIQNRGEEVRKVLASDAQCFKTNSNGTPVHPLYQRDDAAPVHFGP